MRQLQSCCRHYFQNCSYFFQLPNVERSLIVCAFLPCSLIYLQHLMCTKLLQENLLAIRNTGRKMYEATFNKRLRAEKGVKANIIHALVVRYFLTRTTFLTPGVESCGPFCCSCSGKLQQQQHLWL